MIDVAYTPSFIKQTKSLESVVFKNLKQKILLFKDVKNHKSLKVHKLHGRLDNCYAFSVDHKTRVIFEYLSKSQALFLDVGTHDVYR